MKKQQNNKGITLKPLTSEERKKNQEILKTKGKLLKAMRREKELEKIDSNYVKHERPKFVYCRLTR